MQNYDLDGFGLKELNDVEVKRAIWDQNFKHVCCFANLISNVEGNLTLESIAIINAAPTDNLWNYDAILLGYVAVSVCDQILMFWGHVMSSSFSMIF
jgi:hypothetical protein